MIKGPRGHFFPFEVNVLSPHLIVHHLAAGTLRWMVLADPWLSWDLAEVGSFGL